MGFEPIINRTTICHFTIKLYSPYFLYLIELVESKRTADRPEVAEHPRARGKAPSFFIINNHPSLKIFYLKLP